MRVAKSLRDWRYKRIQGCTMPDRRVFIQSQPYLAYNDALILTKQLVL